MAEYHDKNSYNEVFYGLSWKLRIDERRHAYLTIKSILAHQPTIAFFIKSQVDESRELEKNNDKLLKLSKITDNTGNDLLTQVVSISSLDGISEARRIYKEQCIVNLYSLYEQIIFDFAKCVFCSYPKHIYDFLPSFGGEKVHGKIDFMEIINANDIDGIIYKYASIAAKRISKSEQIELEKQLIKITDKKIKKSIFADFTKYIKDRHQIVHELAEVNYTDAFVISGFEALESIVSSFEEIAKDMSIGIEEFPAD